VLTLRRTIVLVAAFALIVGLAAGIAYTQATLPNAGWLKGTTDQKLAILANLQPGMGTVMMEYGARFTNAYYAAKGGNWELAAYMIDEMKEIQEVGENTRPGRAGALKAFETNYLDKLDAAVKAKNWSQYQSLTPQVVNACNQCHVSSKPQHPYIVYQVPSGPVAPLKMSK
jgi:hypothetical protein